VLDGRTDAYSGRFRELVQTARQRIDALAEAWRAVPPAGQDAEEPDGPAQPAGRADRVRAVGEARERLAETLADLAAVTAKKPWRDALEKARLARHLAPDKDAFAKEAWVKSLVQDAAARGKAAVADAAWYDAATAYAALEELVPREPAYHEALETVRRHVRVLALYGQPNGEDEANDEGAGEEEDDERPWFVRDADANMVHQAIEKVHRYYVTRVDFRALARAGLEGVKVLVQTPQAAHSFPVLKNDKQREAFVAEIDHRLEQIAKRPRVDEGELRLALEAVLRASERTLRLPTEVLVVEFTDGFLGELDRFSNMIWPEAVSEFDKDTQGGFSGVGIQITQEEGEPLKVVTPLAGSPAYEAGIRPGDLIVKVRDHVTGQEKRTRTLRMRKIIKLIMGEPGTRVTLWIRRQGRPALLEKVLTRRQITIVTIKGWRRTETEKGRWRFRLDAAPDVGYVRLTQFTRSTAEELREALQTLRNQGVRSIVLDLRFNRGGLLGSAIDVADAFLGIGRVVSTRGRQVPVRVHRSGPAGEFEDGQLAVLINETSASAAEIVSGALKDRGRAIVVGERSYGKGSVQNVFDLPGRAKLKLTTAHYYLPSGRLLHRSNGATDWGVNPHVETFMTPRRLHDWMELQRETDLIQDISEGELSALLARQYDADLQLRTAVLLLQLREIAEAMEDQAVRPAA